MSGFRGITGFFFLSDAPSKFLARSLIVIALSPRGDGELDLPVLEHSTDLDLFSDNNKRVFLTGETSALLGLWMVRLLTPSAGRSKRVILSETAPATGLGSSSMFLSLFSLRMMRGEGFSNAFMGHLMGQMHNYLHTYKVVCNRLML